MAFYNHFPDTDFQSINLDKIVQKIGDIDRAVESSEASATAAARSADNAEDSAAFAQDSATAAASSAEQASATAEIVEENKAEILNAVPDLQRQINVNSGRIDEIASLPAGSTSGDAELADIRIGANGVTYNTAGNAVRGQYNELNINLDGATGGITPAVQIGYTLDGNGNPTPAATRCLTDFIKVDAKEILAVIPPDMTIQIAARFYDADQVYKAAGSYRTATGTFNNANYPYVRFVFGYANNAAADAALAAKVSFFLLDERNTDYHGRIIYQASSCLDCQKDGYYSFGAADIPLISDLPRDLSAGGILKVYSHAAGGARYQEIIEVSGERYARVGSGRFTKVSDNSKTIFPTWVKGALVASTGAEASSAFRIRTGQITTGDGIQLTTPDDMELTICAYAADGTHVKSWTMMSGTQYHYPVRNESYCRVFGGYIDRRTIADDTAAQEAGNLIKIKTIGVKTGALTYYSLGDSITEGYYSETREGGIAGTTVNNYPTYAALANGWKLRNWAVGGSGYLKPSDSLNLPNGRDLVDSIDFSECDICTLDYGVNDWHYNMEIGTVNDNPNDSNTMASNMKHCILKILNDNPRCRLNIMIPLNCSAYGGTFNTDWGLGTSLPTSGTLQHVTDVIREIAEYYHLPVIDQTKTGIANRWNINEVLPDGIHPGKPVLKPYGERIAKQIV